MAAIAIAAIAIASRRENRVTSKACAFPPAPRHANLRDFKQGLCGEGEKINFTVFKVYCRFMSTLRQSLIFATLESVFALLLLFLIPGDTKNALLFGLSSARLGLAGVLLAILGGLAWLTWKSLTSEAFAQTLLNRFRAWAPRRFVWVGMIAFSLGMALLGLTFFYVLTGGTSRFQPYLLRLSPLGLFFTLLGVQNLWFLPTLRHPQTRPQPWPYVASFGLLLALAGLMAFTRLGLLPPPNSWGFGWGDPAVPVLIGQGLWALGAGALFLGLFAFARPWFQQRHISLKKLDLLLCLVIWGVALVVWNRQPFDSNWFAPAPRPPTFERYPYSDAFIHDVIAQNLLVGEGLRWAEHQVPRRPLYGLFLAGLHALAGQDYDRVIRWQMLGLVLFPVAVYLLGTRLHHRASGIVAAALIIFREQNALVLSDTINVSHAKLLMSDLPTAVLVSGFTLLCVLWLQNPPRHRALPLALGGVLGLTMLVRTQALLLLSVPLLFSLLVLGRRAWGRWGQSALLMGFGLLLVVSPWLCRNWRLTGGLAFDETNSQVGMIARRLSTSPEDFDSALRPGETEAEYTRRMSEQTVTYLLRYPGKIAHLITASFLHSHVSTALILPASTWGEGAEEYVRRTGYWFKWEGAFQPTTYFPLALNLSLVAVGLGAAWARRKWLGWLPLGIFWVYALSNAIATISGWRFMLPADWVGMLYFSMGFVHVSLFVGKSFSPRSGPEPLPDPAPTPTLSGSPTIFLGLSALLLVTGLSLPLTEALIPPRFTPLEKTQTLAYLTEHGITLPMPIQQQVENALAQPKTVVLTGRGLYPRVFPAEEGLLGGDWPSSGPRACDRLSLFLVGPANTDILLPLTESPTFPNATDLLIVGYPGEKFVEAVVIIPLDPAIAPLLSASSAPGQCPALDR